MQWGKIITAMLFLGIVAILSPVWDYDSIDLALDLSVNSAETESLPEEKDSPEKENLSKSPQTNNTSEDHSGKPSYPYIRVVDMHLTPVTFSEENYFYVRFKNSGSTPIKNLTATFDLGRSIARRAEIRQEKMCNLTKATGTSILSFLCEQVNPEQVVDVLLTINLSLFEKISFSSSSMSSVVEYSHEDYIDDFVDDSPITFGMGLARAFWVVLLIAGSILVGRIVLSK